MSTEIAKSKTSLNVENDPEATATPTPALSTKNDAKDVDGITEKDPSTLEKAEAPANGPDESDLLTGKRLWLVWSAFLLYVVSWNTYYQPNVV